MTKFKLNSKMGQLQSQIRHIQKLLRLSTWWLMPRNGYSNKIHKNGSAVGIIKKQLCDEFNAVFSVILLMTLNVQFSQWCHPRCDNVQRLTPNALLIWAWRNWPAWFVSGRLRAWVMAWVNTCCRTALVGEPKGKKRFNTFWPIISSLMYN